MKHTIAFILFISVQSLFAQTTPMAATRDTAAACSTGETAAPPKKMVKKTATTAAQTTAQFEVWGNCGMCKKTIETAAKNVAGVSAAEWNTKTHQFVVVFDGAKTNVGNIHKAIATAGYDTDQVRGDDTAYKNLHECCHYDRRQ